MKSSRSDFVDAIYNKLDALRITTKEVLTQEETALYTGLSVNTLYGLTSKRQIPFYKRGGKSYFKRKEIEDWMTADKRYSQEENERRAEAYLRNRRKREIHNNV